MGRGFEFQNLANEALINNVLGCCAFTVRSDSATVGVRNHGISIGAATAASGLYTMSWPTTTGVIRSGVSATFGQYGTDSNLPPAVYFQLGNMDSGANHPIIWVEGVNTAGATFRMINVSLAAVTTNSAVSMGVVTATAMNAIAFVRPATMSAIAAQSFSFNSVTASAVGA